MFLNPANSFFLVLGSDIDVREGGDDDVDISDEEIIGHALRHEPVRLYWTADQIIKQNVIESIKKGMMYIRK